VNDWEIEDVLVMVEIAISCQEMLTSKRCTIVSALPTLEDLLLGKGIMSGCSQISTSNIAKYRVGQAIKTMHVTGFVMSITPAIPDATSGKGVLEVGPRKPGVGLLPGTAMASR
jgi:hypothetical protein